MSIHAASVRTGVAELFHAAEHAGLFIRACGWCGEIREIDFADAHRPGGVSHGICETCRTAMKAGR